jgi:CHAD domain-containing protein
MAKAWDVPGLRPGAVFRDAAGRVILTRWREMMSYRDGTLAGEDIEQLHAMRVASRRLRAAMDAFESAFPAKSFRPYLRRVKQVTDVLGEARDYDVAVERLLAVMPAMAQDERAGLEGLVARYRQERAAEGPRIEALFAAIDDEGFEKSFIAYVKKHTGIKMADLNPVPPEA